jgi:hypothetical protein
VTITAPHHMPALDYDSKKGLGGSLWPLWMSKKCGNAALGDTGPFYLAALDWGAPSLTLEHFAAFPDAAGRWDAFAAPQPEMQINYPSGAAGSYFNVTGTMFPPDSTASIVANGHILAHPLLRLPSAGDAQPLTTRTRCDAPARRGCVAPGHPEGARPSTPPTPPSPTPTPQGHTPGQ